MPTSTTTLRLKVDGKPVADLDKQLNQAFSPTKARDFNRSSAELGRELARITKTADALGASINKTTGGPGFKKLQEELAAATAQSEKLHKSFERLIADKGKMGGGGFGGGFGGGVGSGRSAGGGPAGGNAERGGMMAGLFGGLPLIGAAIGGILNLMFSMFGSALQDASSSRETFAFRGRASDRQFGSSYQL